METALTVEVYCPVVPWSYNPRYRIYIDNELMAERTWGWNWHSIIEHFVLFLNPELLHKLKIEPVYDVSLPPIDNRFKLENLSSVVGWHPINISSATDIEIAFSILK